MQTGADFLNSNHATPMQAETGVRQRDREKAAEHTMIFATAYVLGASRGYLNMQLDLKEVIQNATNGKVYVKLAQFNASVCDALSSACDAWVRAADCGASQRPLFARHWGFSAPDAGKPFGGLVARKSGCCPFLRLPSSSVQWLQSGQRPICRWLWR
jgi:hypothetical protein